MPLLLSLVQVCGSVMCASRKGVTSAAINFVTTLLQAYGANRAVMQQWMWRAALRALDRGARTMAAPLTHASLQSRTEMLNGLSVIYGVLKEQLQAEDLRMLLRWLDR